MSLDVLLVSDQMIKDRTSVHGNIDPKLIYPDIKAAQDMYVLPILGTGLFNKLQTLISDNTIGDAANANYKLLLDRYVVDTLIYFTLSELPVTISFQFWNKGVVRKQGDNADPASMSELVDLSNKYKNRAEFYANRLKYYLLEYASTQFPEYLNPGSTADTITPGMNQFSLPVYLGDDRDNPYCNPGGFNGQPYSE